MPANNWSGFYAGAAGGYAISESPAWTMSGYSTGYQFVGPVIAPVYAPFGVTSQAQLITNTGGPIGEVFAGYNLQFGKFVVGPEVSFGVPIGAAKTATFALPGLGAFPQTAQLGHGWDYVVMADARVGFEMFPHVLPYLKGGLTIAQTSATLTSGNAWALAAGYGASHQAFAGWNIGGGIDWQVPNIPGLTVGVELNHIDVGHRTVSTAGLAYGASPALPGVAATQYIANGATRSDVVKLRLSFQLPNFWGAPPSLTGNIGNDAAAFNSNASATLAKINSTVNSGLSPATAVNTVKAQLQSAGLPN